MDSTRGGGGTEPRYRGGGALGGGWRLSPVSLFLYFCLSLFASQLYSHNTKCSISILFLFLLWLENKLATSDSPTL